MLEKTGLCIIFHRVHKGFEALYPAVLSGKQDIMAVLQFSRQMYAALVIVK